MANFEWFQQYKKEVNNCCLGKGDYPCLGHGILYEQEYLHKLDKLQNTEDEFLLQA